MADTLRGHSDVCIALHYVNLQTMDPSVCSDIIWITNEHLPLQYLQEAAIVRPRASPLLFVFQIMLFCQFISSSVCFAIGRRNICVCMCVRVEREF